jgi:nitroreductase
MDAFLAVVSKREVREYDGRPLAPEPVRRILEAGRLAGSSRNRQQRRFVVLRDPGAAAGFVYSPGNLTGAALAVAIVIAGKGPAGLDAGRAAQNMMIVAQGEGIGSCPNGVADAGAIASLLGLAEGEAVATILTFGYPLKARDPARRSAEEWIARADRLPFDEVVSER